MTDKQLMQMALDALEYPGPSWPDARQKAAEALRARLSQPEQEPVGNTITFMTRAIFNVVAKHQEINGGYFIADGDVAAFVDRLAKVINSTFEPLKPKNTAPPQREWQGLTDEEIREFEIWLDDEEEKRGWNPPADIVKHIEAKLKEKNT